MIQNININEESSFKAYYVLICELLLKQKKSIKVKLRQFKKKGNYYKLNWENNVLLMFSC